MLETSRLSENWRRNRESQEHPVLQQGFQSAKSLQDIWYRLKRRHYSKGVWTNLEKLIFFGGLGKRDYQPI